MNWKPTADRVILERIKGKQGLVLLTDAELVREFRVIAIGPKVTEVKAGQIVVLPGVAAEEPDRKLGGYIIVTQDDIGAIVERKTAVRVKVA